MPLLTCSAQSCIYNKGMNCSRGDIQVEGSQARSSEDTCCHSFEERTKNGAENSMGHASAVIDIDCKAETCVYNENCKCTAGKVGIVGASACEPEETECASYRKG
ncbi:MAG: DUF1540 domain-containing protein [Anaerostipes sp.]|uniref:DUF1540 domain-containing protein n=1 Tax=Anaerostipes sp. 992a TaxID=1261637 RepID=UPI0009519A85|nr:DUF1540 domain-containing protein [Anaerostipes sp. 992a]MCI5952212.1 DUF1540 domain-containing protein [Anaerostipes sp.]MDD5969259.1 DUF1540 domain-containing protein [Anaerostipes sp.]OLR63823.1 hypothetical protein BHF69_03080 [Anaerostipes sp. 992a]